MTDKILVITTCGSPEEAERIAFRLVEKHLAACVNISSPVRSVYRWKGALETAEEWMLTIKTRRDQFAAVREEVALLHSYDVPELIALPIVDGAETYLDWLEAQLNPQ